VQSSLSLKVDLPYRPPIAWDRLLAFLAARAAPSVEAAGADGYARTVRVGPYAGVIRVARSTNARRGDSRLILVMSPSLAPVIDEVVARARDLFDLDADTTAIETQLAVAGLAPPERLRSGLRVPGAFDSFELAVRAILGQQVSVAGASTLMSRFTAKFGEPFATDHPTLNHLAATANRTADATVPDIRSIGLPVARATTIHRLAREVVEGRLRIEAGVDAMAVMEQLTEIPGIGPWTSGYIAMRAMRWSDAFPASDLVLRRSAGAATPRALLESAERWRPWRAYAAMQLWSGINDLA
jgi:AraC family transcriptional regulator of adaptative response / DNA-3-methyladenine glycosylase II